MQAKEREREREEEREIALHPTAMAQHPKNVFITLSRSFKRYGRKRAVKGEEKVDRDGN